MKRVLSIVISVILMAMIPLSGSAAIRVTKTNANIRRQTSVSSKTSTSAVKRKTTSTTKKSTTITVNGKIRSTKAYYTVPTKTTRSVVTRTSVPTKTTRSVVTRTSSTSKKSSTNKGSSSSKSSSSTKRVEVESVSLNETYVNMLGEPVTLIATNSPSNANQKITWSSSNESIATVSADGTVTPVGYGSCTIIAKADNGKTAYCTITVRDDIKYTKEITIWDDWTEPLNHYTIKDYLTVYVDGVNGINNSYSEQYLDHSGFGLVSISKGGIQEIYRTSTVIQFRSTYNLSGGIAATILKQISPIAISSEGSVSKTYTMDNKGNFSISDY